VEAGEHAAALDIAEHEQAGVGEPRGLDVREVAAVEINLGGAADPPSATTTSWRSTSRAWASRATSRARS
jgi:hypothetical protein